MSDQFHLFATAVNRNLAALSKHELYVVDGLDLMTSYLLSFPEGTNPMFRKQTEHECSCCKQFIKNMGGVVAIVDGRKRSVWQCEGLPHPYDVVAKAMDDLVMQLPIRSVFRTKERKFGAQRTHEMSEGGLLTWHHFHGTVADRHFNRSPEEARGVINTTAQVLRRGLEELKAEALETVLELIDSNSLYRGAEHKRAVTEFLGLMRTFKSASNPDLCVWSSVESNAARFRNTAIGTLVQNLSEGMEIERAVRAFETMVAPTNYKRTTAPVTPRMIDAALKTLADLDLEHAVERRFARISDVSVNDVLWVDNGVREQMKDGGLRGRLLEGAAPPKAVEPKNAQAITIDEFVSSVLPTARSMEVMVKNRHMGNFMSITAPQHASTGRLFKWANDFAWSYDGEVADSIKERVKKAGGKTNVPLRVSLAWTNHDDLDLHAHCPEGHVYYGNKLTILDVDMNVSPHTREPVENLSWMRPRDGIYKIFVNQFTKRETKDVGFTLEVECNGQVTQFSHPEAVRAGSNVQCVSFRMERGVMHDFKVLSDKLSGGAISSEKWGVKTEAFVSVSTLMASPNHWEGAGAVGNKHWFFVLKDCRNPEPVRGLYNEFLRGDLEPHRKVFELLGSKTKCQPTDDQLSGLGFSAGRNDEVVVKVTTTSGTRAYTIAF